MLNMNKNKRVKTAVYEIKKMENRYEKSKNMKKNVINFSVVLFQKLDMFVWL